MAVHPKIKLTITTKTENYEVIANPTAIKNWEDRFDKCLSDMANGISMTEIYAMGYEATKAAMKPVAVKFEDWLDDLDDIDIDILEPGNPTEAAPSDA